MARKVSIEILGDSASAERAFARTSRAARGFNHDVTSASKGAIAATIGFKGLGRSLAFASTSFLGGVGLASAAKAAVNAATQIQEETEKTGVVFGKNAKQVQAWAGTLAQSFGIGEGSALKAAGTFGNMFRSLHLGAPEAARMSERLVQLAADMASFNNASPEDTLAALQSGLAGQVRPLRQFGVFLSQDRLKAEAYADGIAKAGHNLNATQKVQAAYNIILKDTAIQQGDVARNTGSLSVAQSKLRAQLEDSEAIIGKALLPSLVNLSNKFAVYLDKLNKSGALQRDAAKAADLITRGLHDIATAATEAKGLIQQVDKVTGSFGNTLKIVAGAFLALKTRAVLAWAGVTSEVAAASAAELRLATTTAGVASRIGLYTGEIATGWDAVTASANAAATAAARAGAGAAAGAAGAATGAGLGLAGKLGALAAGGVAVFTLGDAGEKGQARIVDGRWQFKIGGKWVDVGAAPSKGSSAFTGGQNAFAQGGSLNALSILQATANKSVAATLKGAVRKHVSLLGQFNLLELKLADAERQGNTVLQRSVLVAEEGILVKLRDQAKTLAKRTGFAQQAAAVEDQIKAIDAANVADAKKAAGAAKKAKKASGEFAVPLFLQVAQARAEALGLTGLEKTTLEKIKKKAQAAIRSGKLALDGQLTAWQTIKDVNDQLGNDVQGALTKFRHVSSAKILAGLGLTGDKLREARVRIAMAGAGLTVPPHRSPAFAGAAAGPSGPGGTSDRTLAIYGGVHLHGVQNLRQFEDELNKRARSRPSRRRGV